MTRRPLLIANARILDPAGDPGPRDILVRDGAILSVEPAGSGHPAEAEVMDASGHLVMPGLVNAHTHAHGALGRGAVGDRLHLEMFLNEGAAINGSRTLADKYLSAALSAVEMVRKGCTAAYDLFVEFPVPSVEGIHAVARAYHDVGMRAVVAPMMADATLYRALPGLLDSFPDPLRKRVGALAAAPWRDSIAACEAAFRAWPFDRDRVRPAVAPTIPLHCSDEFLVACDRLSRDFGTGLQTHLAESKTQAVLGLERYGRSLTAHLAGLGILSERMSAAHGIWLDDDDIRLLAEAGVRVSHNPMSNLRIGSGVAPVRRMIEAGVRMAVGTDASNTSDGQNMFEAARLAATLSRVADPDPERWVSAPEAFAMATGGGAELLGFDRTGRIAPGYRADLVFLDRHYCHYVPLRDPLRQAVFAENGAAVARVMIDGRVVFEGGRMLTVDETRLRLQAEEAAERLDRANAGSRELSDAAAAVVGAFCVAQCRCEHPVHRRLPDERPAFACEPA